MFAIFLLLAFSLLTCCSGLKILETPRSQWTEKQIEGNITRNVQKYNYIPGDQGGNYGDLVHLDRQKYDVLLNREVVINPPFTTDTVLELEGRFGRSISSVWVLNFGRERGFTEEIATQGDYVYIRIAIRAGYEIRMLIDVYGFK